MLLLSLPGGPLLARGRSMGGAGARVAAASATRTRVATQLAGKVFDLAGIKGSGFERYGQGNANVIRRRNLLLQLIELDPSLRVLRDRMGLRGDQLPQWLEQDIDALNRVERTDVMTNPGREGFAKHTGLAEVWPRVRKARSYNARRAQSFLQGLTDGSKTFFEVDHVRSSTAILGKIRSPELRARTMVDMLLQLRDAEDRNTRFADLRVGGTALQGIMELRENARRVTGRRGSAVQEREYALMRALATAHPRMSSNAALGARNIMGELRRLSWQLVYGDGAVQPGFKVSPYEAIHRNFSTQTPQVIRAFVGQTVFGGGDPETYCGLVDAMNAARTGKREAATILADTLKRDGAIAPVFQSFREEASVKLKPLGEQIEAFLVSRCQGKLDSSDWHQASLSGDQPVHLEKAGVSTARGGYGKKLSLVAEVYRAVCNAMPTAQTLSEGLFSAKGASRSVAGVVAHLERGASREETLRAIGTARMALRREFGRQQEGHRRMGIWRLDRQLETLQMSQLGASVEAIGDCRTQRQREEALTALHTALKGALASGLDQLRDVKAPQGRSGPSLAEVYAEVTKARSRYPRGKISLEDYRETMSRANEAILRVTDDIQDYLGGRIPHVSQGKLVPNPEYLDNFIKESPLHYAAAIAQQGSRAGLKRRMTRSQVVNPSEVTVLNRVGRVVFDRLLVADSLGELMDRRATRFDFGMVRQVGAGSVDEKKMVVMGGVMANFPAGFSHAANFSRGAGMAALSNAAVGQQWETFAKTVGQDKLYYDDTGGQLVMMPLREALKQGLVKSDEVERLRPGHNRQINYYSWSEKRGRWQRTGRHTVTVNSERSTDVVNIYKPAMKVKGVSKNVLSFTEVGQLGTDARGLVGEKGLVLGLAAVDRKLGKRVPPGSVVTTVGVRHLLQEAGLLGEWEMVWNKDPWVGRVTDKNFTRSRFYQDPDYREQKRQALFELVGTRLRAHLIGKDGKPTAAGRTWLEEILASNPALKRTLLIVRSGYTTEDRPNKSSAGQYDSFPNLSPTRNGGAEVLGGVVGVVTSAWNKQAVENSVSEGYNLRHIWPTIPIMKCVKAELSGVFVTHDPDTGYPQTMGVQATRGFGGGVEHGSDKTIEEGRLDRNGLRLTRSLPGQSASILSKRHQRELYRLGMGVEELFFRVVEPGKGHAIDAEWVVNKRGKLELVQARTVPIRGKR